MAHYALTGTILDQQEVGVNGAKVRLQLLNYPASTTAGSISGQELWCLTDKDGILPALSIVPGHYRIEWRLGPVVNRAWFDMPAAAADLKNILVTDTAIQTPTSGFDTVSAMLGSDAATWIQAEVRNYNPGDGILSIWIKTTDVTLLPNGTDVLQTTGGVTVLRIFVREPDGGIVVPGGGLAPYTVSVPVIAPTITDLRNSLYSALIVWVGDPADPMTFRKGDENALDDGVNGVLNAAGIHYDRIQF